MLVITYGGSGFRRNVVFMVKIGLIVENGLNWLKKGVDKIGKAGAVL